MGLVQERFIKDSIIFNIMEDGKKEIRKWSWILLIFFVLATIILIVAGYFLGTLKVLLSHWSFYISAVISIASLIGLFLYRKWGFYLFSIGLIYVLIDDIIRLDYTSFIIYVIIYGYIIWYKGFYKNFHYLE